MQLAWAALAACLCVAPLARAGYLLVDADGEQMLISKGKLKEVTGDGQGPQSAFDLVAARAWMANPDRRIFWEGTIDDLCKTFRETAASMARAAERQMDRQIEALSPEQRAKVEEMRKGLAAKRAAEQAKQSKKPAVIKVEKTTESETIAGQPTRKYRVLVDGKLYQENWLTTDPALAQEFALDRAAAAMGRVSACAEAGESGSGSAGVDEGEIYRELYLHGWPLRSVAVRDGKRTTRSDVKKVEKRDVPESEFQPPDGYKQAPIGEVMFGAPESDQP